MVVSGGIEAQIDLTWHTLEEGGSHCWLKGRDGCTEQSCSSGSHVDLLQSSKHLTNKKK